MDYHVLIPKRLFKTGVFLAGAFILNEKLEKKQDVPVNVVPELQEWLEHKGKRGVDWDYDAMPWYDTDKFKFEKRGFLFFADEINAMEFKLTWM
jgi:hypothetical protein